MSGDCSCRTAADAFPEHWAAMTPVPVQGAAVEPFDATFPVPAYPPSVWFTEKPEWLTPDTKIGVDDAGRVAGYFYNAGQCLVHQHGACPKPSPTRYAAFHQQEVVTDDGEAMQIGVIGNVNGHASPYARVDVAQAHYADPDRQLILCRAYDDEHGGYILGSMVPGARFADVALVRRSALSGDWRPMPPTWWRGHGIAASVVNECEGYDCIGPTLVNRPGLPLIRKWNEAGRAAAILGGVGGVQLDETEYVMQQTVELPDGTKITTPLGVDQFPGARMAANPPGAPPAPDGPPDAHASSPEQAIAALDQRLSAVEDAVGQIVAKLQEMMGQQMAAIEAAAATSIALPEPADPKA